MIDSSLEQAARILRDHRDELAKEANQAFLDRHPEWGERFGEKARIHGEEDARFHLDFLASALDVDRPELFREYLRWTAFLLESRGMKAESLEEHVRDVLDAARGRLSEAQDARVSTLVETTLREAGSMGPLTFSEPERALSATAGLYTDAALRGNRAAARNLVEAALEQGIDLADLYLDVLQASQYEVGRRWFRNEITVAQEHMATAITQMILTSLYPRLSRIERERGTAVVTGVRSELHQLGAHMVSDFLESDGWSVRFLGTQMPHGGILDLLREDQPILLGISVTISTNLPAARELVADVRSLDHPPRVLVGGAAFSANEGLWREIGADATGRDLREAVDAARRLAPD